MARNMYEDAEAPDGVELYDPDDYVGERNRIFSTIKDTFIKQFPREHNGVRMELVDVDYEDPKDFTLAQQKKALHSDSYLSRKLKGTLRLVDMKTGNLLDEKRMTLLKAPWLTNRHTFIREGNEWGTIAQQRLLPGAYSRIQNNGDIETQFNVRPGTGAAFRVQFNPESAQYKLSLGGSEIHLYSLLKDLGIDHSVLAKKWGDEIADANAEKYDPRTFEKAYNKLVPSWDRDKNKERTHEEKVQLIQRALNRSQVATSVLKRTLPNLTDRVKAASWREQGQVFEKLASLSAVDLQDIAYYINVLGDKNIDTELPKAELEQAIKNTISTGYPDGDINSNMDPADAAAAAVRQNKMRRVVETINNKLKKHTIHL